MSSGNWLLVFGLVAAGVAAVLFAAPSVLPPVTPYVDAGPDMTVDECYPVRLAGEGYDPAGGEVVSKWKADKSLGSFDDAGSLHPIYTTPEICGDCQDVQLTLTVTNKYGLSASDSLTLHVCAGTCQIPSDPCSMVVPSALGITTIPSGCEQECTPAVTNVNQAPSANAGADITMNECASVQLTCDASDPDGDVLTYHWSASGNRGSFDNANVLHPIYTAPVVACAGTEDVTLTLTVTDSCGASASDTMIVHVANVNQAPSANAGADITMNECASVQLTCDASDPDGDVLTYHWSASGNRGSFDNANVLHPIYTAPVVACAGTEDVTLTLTVTDSCGASASDTMIVHVDDNSETSPAASLPLAGAEDGVRSVSEGGCFQLHGIVCDPDGNLARIWWTADKGHFDDTSKLDPVYYAPMLSCEHNESVKITLHAIDKCGVEGSDYLMVTVTNTNHYPEVTAGPDRCVVEGSKVQLTCDASDLDGDTLSYHWEIKGNWGYLDTPYSSHPMYTAPSLAACDSGMDVVLVVTVTDTHGFVVTDSMVVHVISNN